MYEVNLLAKVPKAAQQTVATLVRSIYAQPDADSTHAQCDQVIGHLEGRYSAAAELLGNAREGLLAFTAFPKAVWRQIWSNTPLERLGKKVRRRTDVVGIFAPDRRSPHLNRSTERLTDRAEKLVWRQQGR